MSGVLKTIARFSRPTFTEMLDMEWAMASALLDMLPTLEDGRDLDYLARMLGKKD